MGERVAIPRNFENSQVLQNILDSINIPRWWGGGEYGPNDSLCTFLMRFSSLNIDSPSRVKFFSSSILIVNHHTDVLSKRFICAKSWNR
jgi:hypothetical protein